MARTVSYYEYGAPCANPVKKTAVVHDYRNSRGDKATILHRDGRYEVSSRFFKYKVCGSFEAAAKVLIDRSPIGCSDWEEVEQIDVMEAKRRFVQEELAAMLRAATEGYVAECWYETDGAVEYVWVSTGPGRAPLIVNVTADSPWAIAKDVMRAVAGVYE